MSDVDTANAAESFVGKRIVAENGTVFAFGEDGTIGGSFRDQPVVGTYFIDGDAICSTYTAPEPLAGRDYCSVPDITGDTVVFNRRDGTQSGIYRIEG